MLIGLMLLSEKVRGEAGYWFRPLLVSTGYFDQDMQIKALLFAGNVSHKILYEVAYYTEIIIINVYSS